MHKIGRVVAAALAGLVVPAATAQDAVQWRIEDGGNGHWYALVHQSDPIDWDEAQLDAAGVGGHLATLTTEAENNWVFAAVASGPSGWFNNGGFGQYGPWIGGLQSRSGVEPSGDWRWVTSETWEFQSWAPCGLPNETTGGTSDYLRLHGCGSSRAPGWNDDPIDSWPSLPALGAIREWSADCNNDGIVDYGQILDGSFADEDLNGVPDCCENDCPCELDCPGDLNGDDAIGPPDLGILLAVWGTDGGKIGGADLNDDGTVNAADLGLLIGAWGDCGCN